MEMRIGGLTRSSLDDLEVIGRELDQDKYPIGRRGGIVKPGQSIASNVPQPGEGNDDGQGTRRSETEPGQRAARGQGQTRRAWAPDSSASLIGRSGSEALESALSGLQEAYPGALVERRDDGFWLRATSRLLEGSSRWAQFVVAVPHDAGWGLQAWGFWQDGSWIGPRHTNFPLGSICAFFPSDGTWRMGDSFVTLLDIYSLWAVRHLHLEIFGRWPGRQKARWPFERIVEARPDELCGCGSMLKYTNCCRQEDLHCDFELMRQEFLREALGGRRTPPPEVIAATRGKISLPTVRAYVIPPAVPH
jgi:hypothetical protein